MRNSVGLKADPQGAPYNAVMIDLKSETEKFRAELRSTRWFKAAVISAIVGAVGIGAWIGVHYWLVRQEPPELKMFTDRAPDGVALADLFLSYESVPDVTAKLEYDQLRAERSASHKKKSKRYPPRDLDTLEVRGFKHLGQTGELTLEFFNDRLYEARFIPEELDDGYAQRLHAADAGLPRDKTGNIDATRGPLRVTSNVDFASSKVGRALNTRPFVIWQDQRLKQQLKLWEDTYGAESIRSE